MARSLRVEVGVRARVCTRFDCAGARFKVLFRHAEAGGQCRAGKSKHRNGRAEDAKQRRAQAKPEKTSALPPRSDHGRARTSKASHLHLPLDMPPMIAGCNQLYQEP